MTNAKSGDKIVCIVENTDAMEFTYLNIYTIENTLESGRTIYLLLCDDDGWADWHSSQAFMLLEEYRKITINNIISE